MTAPIAVRRLNAADQDFARHLDHLLSWESVSDDGVNQRVLEIIQAVRERGKHQPVIIDDQYLAFVMRVLAHVDRGSGAEGGQIQKTLLWPKSDLMTSGFPRRGGRRCQMNARWRERHTRAHLTDFIAQGEFGAAPGQQGAHQTQA